jgi:hypothetical protein
MSALPRIDVDTASRDKLIAHIDALEYMLAMTVPTDADVIDIMRSFKCPRQIASALACFLKSRVVTVEHLQTVCTTCGNEPTPRHIAVLISRLRSMLRRHEVEIDVVWGRGYEISRDGTQRIRSLVETVQGGKSEVPA